MPFDPPVVIDITNGATLNSGILYAQVPAIIATAGKLWWIGQSQIDNSASLYRSDDNGVTWVLDSAVPIPSTFGTYLNWSFDSLTQRILIAYKAVTGEVAYKEYDFSAWTSESIVGGSTCDSVYVVEKNASGDTVIVYLDKAIDPTAHKLFAVVYNGGFGTPFSVDDNATYHTASGPINDTGCAGVFGTGGIYHLLYVNTNDAVPGEWIVMYQQIDVAGQSIGAAFFSFPVQTLPYPNVGQPAILGTDLYIPYYDDIGGGLSNAGVYIGDASGGGPFVFTGGIDPDPTININGGTQGLSISIGGTLYFAYVAVSTGGSNDRGRVRLLTTTDGITWTGETAIDDAFTILYPSPNLDGNGNPDIWYFGFEFSPGALGTTLTVGVPSPPPVTVILNAQSLLPVALGDPLGRC